MSSTWDDPDLEARVRRAMHSLADSHEPVPARGRGGAAGDTTRRRWLVAAAAGILVVGGLAAVAALARRDAPAEPTVRPTPASVPATSGQQPQGIPNAAGDFAIDPTLLRFADPLPDGTAAFVDDPSLPPPQLATESDFAVIPGDPIPIGEQPDSVSIVAMDGPRLLMRGAALDLPVELVESEPSGPIADVGVDGARYVDEDEGAIVIPLDDGLRIVAPDDHFAFGGGGPHIDPDALVGIATAIGRRPLGDVDDLPGFYVFDGVIAGEEVGPGFFAEGTVAVEHTPAGSAVGGVRVTLQRLPEPPTALELIAVGHALTRGRIESAAVGDVGLFAGPDTYVELVSPVDLLIVTAPSGAAELVDAIDVAPVAELELAADS